MDKYIDLAKKLNLLAEKGFGGEKINAEKALDALMKKYNITRDQLDETVRTLELFRVPKDQRRLFMQVVYSIMGKNNDVRQHRVKKSVIFVNCNKLEYLEIASKFAFYWRAYKKQLDTFYFAFLQTNDIFPNDPDLRVQHEDLSEEEKEKRRRAALMSMAMPAEEYRKEISG